MMHWSTMTFKIMDRENTFHRLQLKICVNRLHRCMICVSYRLEFHYKTYSRGGCYKIKEQQAEGFLSPSWEKLRNDKLQEFELGL